MIGKHLILCCLCLAAGAISGAVYRSASVIHSLPNNRDGESVAFTGVVTFAPKGRNTFVVADLPPQENPHPAVGVYVRARGAAAHPKLAVGDTVEVLGSTESGRFAMSVAATNITVKSAGGRLPPTLPATAADLVSGRYDCRRVAVEGTVACVYENAGSEKRESQLLLRTITGEIMVFIDETLPSAELRGLLDCDVRATGVVFPIMNARNEMVGARVGCDGLADVEIVQHAPPTPFDAEAIDPHRLTPITPAGAIRTRRTTHAVVTACTPHGFYCLLDDDTPLLVLVDDDARPQPGTVVEVAGYLTSRNFLAAIEHTIWRPSKRSATLPDPIPLTRTDILTDGISHSGKHPDFDGRIVTITGSLIQRGISPEGHPFLVIDLDGYPVAALAPDGTDFSAFGEDCVVAVTGVAVMSFEGEYPALDNLRVTGFRLALRDTGDVVVLSRPSWWTPGRLLAVIGGLLALVGIFIYRSVRLARIVERRTAQLFAQRRQTLELQTRTDERTRLATDLHDSLEQELTGTAMQLEAARIALEHNPALAPKKLAQASSQLAETRAELHRTVWGLRDPLIREGRLVEALRKKYLNGTVGGATKIVLVDLAPGLNLPGVVTYHLFQAASEAVTNALKHAQAKTVTIKAESVPDEDLLVISVTDDGVGFDVAAAPGPDQGHFGLQGMRERMARIHGTCAIESRKGLTRFTFTASTKFDSER